MDRVLAYGISKRLWFLALVLLLLIASIVPIRMLASEIGGYVSEKLIERSGTSSSSLVISRGNPQIDIAMGPVISTLPATNAHMNGDTTATLNGNLSSLNGFPSVNTWFEWSYDASYSNSTATQVLSTVSSFSAEIAGFSNTQIVYYRAVAETDGRAYGATQQFGPVQDNPFRLAIIIGAIFGLVVLVAMLAILAKSPTITGAILAAVLGIMGVIMVIQLVNIILELW